MCVGTLNEHPDAQCSDVQSLINLIIFRYYFQNLRFAVQFDALKLLSLLLASVFIET